MFFLLFNLVASSGSFAWRKIGSIATPSMADDASKRVVRQRQLDSFSTEW